MSVLRCFKFMSSLDRSFLVGKPKLVGSTFGKSSQLWKLKSCHRPSATSTLNRRPSCIFNFPSCNNTTKSLTRNFSSSKRSKRVTGVSGPSIRTWAAALDAASMDAEELGEPKEVPIDSNLEEADIEALGVTNFESLGVEPILVSNLASNGFLEPTYVQAAAFPLLVSGCNAALQSHTGSGKTLAYLLPLLTRAIQLDRQQGLDRPPVRLVVVVPSRELAMQIVRQVEDLVGWERRSIVQQAIGGANSRRQIEGMKKNCPMVVVGTPGRLAELSRSGDLRTHETSMLMMDEADQLLSDNMKEDMQRLDSHIGCRLPEGRQTVVVSATLTSTLLKQLEPWCPDPQRLAVTRQGGVAVGEEVREQETGGLMDLDLPDTLDHLFVRSSRRHRVDTIRRAIHAAEARQALVFMNFNKRLQDTAGKLSARKGMDVGALHGELDKQERANIMQQFRRGDLRALIVSDVASRGLDVPECDAVFQLELPTDAACYAHRAGRTGRFGRPGLVVTVVEPHEAFVINKIEKQLGIKIYEATVANGRLRIGTAEELEELDSQDTVVDENETDSQKEE